MLFFIFFIESEDGPAVQIEASTEEEASLAMANSELLNSCSLPVVSVEH